MILCIIQQSETNGSHESAAAPAQQTASKRKTMIFVFIRQYQIELATELRSINTNEDPLRIT